MRNVLVVSTVERSGDALREAVGGDIDELRVVVPVVHQSRLNWLANDEDDARERAAASAAAIGEAVDSQSTTTEAGDSDPLQAAVDELRKFTATEIVVVTRPDEQASWLEEGKADEIAEKLGGLPVRRIELSDS